MLGIHKPVVIMFPVTPPTCLQGNNSLTRANSNFYVPDDSVSAYKSASYWSNYASSIYGFSQLAIDYPEYYEAYMHIYD